MAAHQGLQEAYIRILLTRGVGELTYHPSACPTPTVVVIVKPFPGQPERTFTQGIRIALVGVRRNHPLALNPMMKSNNLLNNALRHTPAGGTVTLAVDQVRDGVRFTVTDTGEGIPAEHLPHIFERFYRVEPSHGGGSGIGLAVARAIIEVHNGRISAASEGAGTGATFTILLPPAS